MSRPLHLRGIRPYGAGDPVDLLVRDGVIAEVLDGGGLVALPGLVDLHAHLREPGREDARHLADLASYTLGRIMRWARRKHHRITVKTISRRYCNHGWWPTTPEIRLFNPDTMRTTRYRYPGTASPSPWPATR